MKTPTRFGLAATIAVTFSAASPIPGWAGAWRPQWDSPKSVLERSSPAMVRVVLEDRSTLLMEYPHVVADSLVGTVGSRREAVPFAVINHLALKKGRGLGLAAGISVVLLGGVLGLFAATWD